MNWDELPGLFAATDGEGRLVSASAGLYRFMGLEPGQITGHLLDELLPPASRILAQTHIWPLLNRTGSASEVFLQLRMADGTRVPALLNARRSLDSSGGESKACFTWSFFVAHERSKFEAAVLDMRRRAESLAETLAQRERFLRDVTEALPGLVAHWDANLRCTFANAAHEAVFQRPATEIVGMHLADLLGPARMPSMSAALAHVMTGKAQQLEGRFNRADGTQSIWQMDCVPQRDTAGQVIGFFVLGSDITRLKEASIAQRLVASVFRSIREGIVVADAQGQVLSVNPAFCDLTGWTEREMIGRPAPFARPEQESTLLATMWETLALRGQWHGELWCKHRDGDEHLLAQSVTAFRDDDGGDVGTGKAQRYVAIYTDVTDRWRHDEKVRQLALYDSLTGLPNRHLLSERLEQLVVRANREQTRVALMFLDLDGFKAVNDEHGHAAGDELLQVVAHRLLDQVRETDTVSRLGGDEFVVLLDNPSSEGEAQNVAQRILASVTQPIALKTVAVQPGAALATAVDVGVSIGIALHGPHCPTAKELMAQADAAMYAAKSAGKGRVHLAPT